MIKVDQKELTLNPAELKRRLQGGDDQNTLLLADLCETRVRRVAECSYYKTEVSINCDDGTVHTDVFSIKSRDLCKNLNGCDKAFLFAVTLGHSVDRLLRQLSLCSAAQHFVTDAVCSALTEALCDYAEGTITAQKKPRFSPGFGDFTLENQIPILRLLKQRCQCPIILTEASLMLPSKSVTFIVGVKK